MAEDMVFGFFLAKKNEAGPIAELVKAPRLQRGDRESESPWVHLKLIINYELRITN